MSMKITILNEANQTERQIMCDLISARNLKTTPKSNNDKTNIQQQKPEQRLQGRAQQGAASGKIEVKGYI